MTARKRRKEATMKKTIVLVLSLALLATCGCASYLKNIGNDATDFFNIGITPGKGVMTRFGPVIAGGGYVGMGGLGLFPRHSEHENWTSGFGLYPIFAYVDCGSGLHSVFNPAPHALQIAGSEYFMINHKTNRYANSAYLIFFRKPNQRVSLVEHIVPPGARLLEFQFFAGWVLGPFISFDPVELADFGTSLVGLDLCGDNIY